VWKKLPNKSSAFSKSYQNHSTPTLPTLATKTNQKKQAVSDEILQRVRNQALEKREKNERTAV
jgi:hypothetical protein